MDSASYLDYILNKLSATHDIVRNYIPEGQSDIEQAGPFPAYASYYSTSEKYVLTRKANLWTAKEYEHILFLTAAESLNEEVLFTKAQTLISDFMEPVFVRKEEKYPPKDHMRTFLTIVLVLDSAPSRELIHRIRKYRFDKGYLFSIRGYAQGRIIAVDLSGNKVYGGPAARDVAAFFKPMI